MHALIQNIKIQYLIIIINCLVFRGHHFSGCKMPFH